MHSAEAGGRRFGETRSTEERWPHYHRTERECLGNVSSSLAMAGPSVSVMDRCFPPLVPELLAKRTLGFVATGGLRLFLCETEASRASLCSGGL
jgi:hypothetical protein